MWCGVEGEGVRGGGVGCEGGLGRGVVFPLLFPSGVTESPLSQSLRYHFLLLVGRRCCHTPCDVAWWRGRWRVEW